MSIIMKSLLRNVLLVILRTHNMNLVAHLLSLTKVSSSPLSP